MKHRPDQSPVKYKNLDFITTPGFRVGSDGSVWSCIKMEGIKGKRGVYPHVSNIWRKLKPVPMGNGKKYLVVGLRIDNKRKNISVHKLVLLAFRGPCPKEMEARHFPNRDPTDNRLENLQWGTRKQNHKDQNFHGTRVKGETHGMAKLTWRLVRCIRNLYKEGARQSDLYRRFKISKSNMNRIVHNKIWKE